MSSDLGSSAGLAAAQREGFERVLSSVALGEVGIVGSREVSRLSRTDKDWCRLLEVCQIFETLIADEQQVYDLNNLDDQLVLGIKGTLSVVELKVIRQRMLAGQEAKARRGELFKRLPIGYARDPDTLGRLPAQLPSRRGGSLVSVSKACTGKACRRSLRRRAAVLRQAHGADQSKGLRGLFGTAA